MHANRPYSSLVYAAAQCNQDIGAKEISVHGAIRPRKGTGPPLGTIVIEIEAVDGRAYFFRQLVLFSYVGFGLDPILKFRFPSNAGQDVDQLKKEGPLSLPVTIYLVTASH
jgi:hypothetical protein